MEAVRRRVDEEGMFEAFVITSHSNRAAVSLYRRTGARTEEADAKVMVYPAASGKSGTSVESATPPSSEG